jgi:hypothetical protein
MSLDQSETSEEPQDFDNTIRDEAADYEALAHTLLYGHYRTDPDRRASAMLLYAISKRLEVIDLELQRARNPDAEPYLGQSGSVQTEAQSLSEPQPQEQS